MTFRFSRLLFAGLMVAGLAAVAAACGDDDDDGGSTPTTALTPTPHGIETTPTPKPSNAQIVNQKDVIVKRARECRRERGLTPNILAVEFAGIGDVVGAASELNGLPPAVASP